MERKIEGNFGKKIERKDIVDKAFSLAKEIIRRTKANEGDFSNLYSQAEIDKDVEYVEKRKLEFSNGQKEEGDNQENIKLSAIFEAIVVVARDWFGKDCQTLKTADFDDIANGIDVVTEFPKREEGGTSSEPIGLAIDVTFNMEFEGKIDRIRDEIKKGKLPMVKYFRPGGKDAQVRKPEIVRAVVGASRDTVIGLAETLIAATKNPKILFENQFQFQALDEIIYQLKTYEAYAKEIGRDSIAEKYGHALSKIRGIKKERSESLTDNHQRDALFDGLVSYLDSSFGSESK